MKRLSVLKEILKFGYFLDKFGIFSTLEKVIVLERLEIPYHFPFDVCLLH